MTAIEQQRAFDPFFTSRKERGTGLGLSIAHGIMEGLGGTIELMSEEGHGTTVTLRFPTTTSRTEVDNATV
jgi:two-component system NtrC family sensor kinase